MDIARGVATVAGAIRSKMSERTSSYVCHPFGWADTHKNVQNFYDFYRADYAASGIQGGILNADSTS